MAYIVGRKRKGKSGILTYYYLVEGYRKDGKVKQKTLKYLGKLPFQTKFDLEPELGVQVAQALSEEGLSPDELKKRLEDLGISAPPGKLNEVRLVFNPPFRKLVVHIGCT